MAREGKLDPVIGRDNETQRLLEILCRRMKKDKSINNIKLLILNYIFKINRSYY